jgi:hypothetical protein
MNHPMSSGEARALIAALERNTRAHLAALPQWYDLADLQVRWSMGRDAVLVQLKHHLGYQGAPGKPVKIGLADVQRIDALLEEYRR